MRTFVFTLFILCTGLVMSQNIRWASEVIDFSSQYSDTQYAAMQALGVPNTPPGPYPSFVAWSPENADSGKEWISLGFDKPMEAVRQIFVYESHNAGALVAVYLLRGKSAYLVWEELNPGAWKSSGRLHNIFIEPTSYKVDGIRLVLDTKSVEGFNHIDAVAVSDSRQKIEPPLKLAGTNFDAVKENLENVNTVYSEVHPMISPDGQTLYFTRKNHPDNLGGGEFDDIWYSQLDKKGRWKHARNIGAPLNDNKHNYLNGITPDGNLALIARTSATEGKQDELCLSRKTTSGWSAPAVVDMKGYYNLNRYHAFQLASDGKTILLSIERRDSYGLKDLYVSFMQSDGSWSEPLNLGSDLNTTEDETTPFLAPDGVTLYFTTTGRYGFGNGDIFVSKRLDDSWKHWSEPLNMGPRINSVEWDANYTLAASGDYAYFTSRNPINKSEDIYRIRLEEQQKPESVVLVKGKVLDAETGASVGANIEWNTLESKIGQTGGYASSDSIEGRYQIVLPGGGEYRFFALATGYYAKVEIMDLSRLDSFAIARRDILLFPIKKGKIIPLDAVSFEANKAIIQGDSYFELDRLASFLLANPGLKIEIGGHTNNLCGESFCRELSEKRAKAVMGYLIKRGVNSQRVLYVGYGSKKPVASNDNAKGRKRNQRVEFKVLED